MFVKNYKFFENKYNLKINKKTENIKNLFLICRNGISNC